jgi:hypothetical protein
LVGAISVADGIPGPVTINLAPNATYDLSAVDNNWYGPNGLPPITNDITIDGNGAIIERDANAPDFRLFYVSGGLKGELHSGSLTLKDVTLEGGIARGGDGEFGGGGGLGAGGAIFNQGVLNLFAVTLTNNQAAGGNGGAGFGGGGGGIGGSAGLSGAGGGFGGNFVGGFGGAGAQGGPGSGGGGGGFVGGADAITILGGGLGGFGGHGGGGFGGAAGDGGSGSLPVNGGAGGAGGGGVGGGGGGTSESEIGDGGSFGFGGQAGPGPITNAGGGGFGGGGGSGYGGGGGGFGAGGGSSFSINSQTFGGSGGFGGGSGGGLGSQSGGGGGGSGLGGAIFNMGDDQSASAIGGPPTIGPDCTLIDCTLTGNTAQGGNGAGDGGGGSGFGGGLFNLDGFVYLADDTLDGNTAAGGNGAVPAGATGAAADGNEVYNLAFGNNIPDGVPTSAAVGLSNSILADGRGGKELASGAVNSNGANTAIIGGSTNLVESLAPGNSTIGANVIAAAGSPQLGPLQNNGGPTPTMALTTTSIAFGAGDANDSLVPATDQRGLARVLFGRLDLGAYENQTVVLPPNVVDFIPTAVMQVNPQPLPPHALVLFAPAPGLLLPELGMPAAGAPTAVTPFHHQGELKESISGGWTLDAVYTLDGQVSPANELQPAGPGSLSVNYRYEARVTETLTPPGINAGPAWRCDATGSNHGELSFVVTKPVTGIQNLIHASFLDTTRIDESCQNAGTGQQNWNVDATVASLGTLDGRDQMTSQVSGNRQWSDVHIDRVIAETLSPAPNARGNPGPWHIDDFVVTDGSAQETFAQGSDGKTVQDHGSAQFVTRLVAIVWSPAPLVGPAPPTKVLTGFFQTDDDYQDILSNSGL